LEGFNLILPDGEGYLGAQDDDWHPAVRRTAMRGLPPNARNGKGAGRTPGPGDTGPPILEKAILVVEDDLGMREVAMSILESYGYHIYGAATGRAGLDAIETHDDVALLVCDVVLSGGMNGPDFAREAQARRPGLKVLFMSGYHDVRGSLAGQIDREAKLIRKPFRGSELRDMVRDLLDERMA